MLMYTLFIFIYVSLFTLRVYSSFNATYTMARVCCIRGQVYNTKSCKIFFKNIYIYCLTDTETFLEDGHCLIYSDGHYTVPNKLVHGI